jgi:hypothetical protein
MKKTLVDIYEALPEEGHDPSRYRTVAFSTC